MEDLDRRGTIYSDRPKLEMGGELVGYSQDGGIDAIWSGAQELS